jgi:hypothetical protein
MLISERKIKQETQTRNMRETISRILLHTLCIYLCICVRMYARTYVYIYVCTYVRIYVWTYVRTHIRIQVLAAVWPVYVRIRTVSMSASLLTDYVMPAPELH